MFKGVSGLKVIYCGGLVKESGEEMDSLDSSQHTEVALIKY